MTFSRRYLFQSVAGALVAAPLTKLVGGTQTPRCEKTVFPPLRPGDLVETTTMRNVRWRTHRPRTLQALPSQES